MSSSSQQNSAPQPAPAPAPNNNVAESELPWSWKCANLRTVWSDPDIVPQTSWLAPCDKLNEGGVDVCEGCLTYIRLVEYDVVRQYAPPPPPAHTQPRNRRRGPRSGR